MKISVLKIIDDVLKITLHQNAEIGAVETFDLLHSQDTDAPLLLKLHQLLGYGSPLLLFEHHPENNIAGQGTHISRRRRGSGCDGDGLLSRCLAADCFFTCTRVVPWSAVSSSNLISPCLCWSHSRMVGSRWKSLLMSLSFCIALLGVWGMEKKKGRGNVSAAFAPRPASLGLVVVWRRAFASFIPALDFLRKPTFMPSLVLFVVLVGSPAQQQAERDRPQERAKNDF